MDRKDIRIQVRTTGADWIDSLDFDPMALPHLGYGRTDPTDSAVVALVDSIMTIQAMVPRLTYRVLWAENDDNVSATCGACGQTFALVDGLPFTDRADCGNCSNND